MKKLLIVFTIVALIFSSCKKNENENPQPKQVIKEYTFTQSNSSTQDPFANWPNPTTIIYPVVQAGCNINGVTTMMDFNTKVKVKTGDIIYFSAAISADGPAKEFLYIDGNEIYSVIFSSTMNYTYTVK